jgi:hypothetical protein
VILQGTFMILQGKFHDTMFLKVKSLRQNLCAQVYTDGQGYSLLYPLKSQSLAWTTIKSLISHMNAIPDAIITDGAMEETGGHWKKETQHFQTVHACYVDISAYAQFDWYSLVWYIDSAEDAATSRRKIGQWIGLAEKHRSGLTYFVLPKLCHPIVRSSVMPISKDKLHTPKVKALIEEYDIRI